MHCKSLNIRIYLLTLAFLLQNCSYGFHLTSDIFYSFNGGDVSSEEVDHRVKTLGYDFVKDKNEIKLKLDDANTSQIVKKGLRKQLASINNRLIEIEKRIAIKILLEKLEIQEKKKIFEKQHGSINLQPSELDAIFIKYKVIKKF